MDPRRGAEVDVTDDELPLLMIRVLKGMQLTLDGGTADRRGLTPVHGIATRYLDRHDDVTTVELAEHLRVTKQSASEIVGVLEGAGFVARRPHPDDGRARVIELTAAGRAALARSRQRWGDLERAWESVVDPGDLATVRRALERYLEANPAGS